MCVLRAGSQSGSNFFSKIIDRSKLGPALMTEPQAAPLHGSPLRRWREAAMLRQLSPTIAYWLRVPQQDCQRILRHNRRFLWQLEKRRNQLQARSAISSHLKRWQHPQSAAYRQLLATDSRARIIAGFHFGDFVYGMNLLLKDEAGQRPCRVLTQQRGTAAYFANMACAFGERGARAENQLPLAQTTTRELSGFLRQTGGTLVTFCDVPPVHGAVTEVTFFGRRAWFPRGAAALALRARVPLLPVISCQQGEHHQLLLSAQIEPDDYRLLQPREAVQAITQRLVSLLEEGLQRYPEQWRYLAALPRFFQPPGSPEKNRHNTERRTKPCLGDTATLLSSGEQKHG